MLFERLGQSDINASRIVFGAWAIGGWKWGGTDADQSINAIRAAIDAGVNCIDTAAVYGFGLSEQLVGEAIKPYKRQDIVLATKCGLRWDIETPTLHAESEGKKIYRTLSRDSILWEVDESLSRLGTDYIDLYQTHWPDPMTTADDVLHTFDELISSGKVRAVGFCNSTKADLEVAGNRPGFCSDQEKYSMVDREQESLNLPVVRNHPLAFLAYSPLAQGLLTGAVTAERTFAESDLRHGNPRFSAVSRQRVAAVLQPVKSVADELGVSVGQVVTAWTLQQPGVSHLLAGTRTAQQAVHNAAAGDLILSTEALNQITEAADQFEGFEQ